MKKNKIILLTCILSISFIGIVNAQNVYEIKKNAKVESDFINKKLLKKEISNQTVNINIDLQSVFLTIDTIKVKFSKIQKTLNKKGYILIEKASTLPIPPEPKEKPKMGIDEFLNIVDASIFTTNFIRFDLVSIHPRSKDYYRVIEIIHDLGEKLQDIENDWNNYRSNPNVTISVNNKERTLTGEEAKKFYIDSAKEGIDNADQMLDNLAPFQKEFQVLTKIQKTHYENLTKKFDDLSLKIK